MLADVVQRAILIICGAIIAICTLANGFLPESMALWSRISQKNHPTVNGYQIDVPAGWSVSRDQDSVTLLQAKGRIRSYFSGPSLEMIFLRPTPRDRKLEFDQQRVVDTLYRIHQDVTDIKDRKAGDIDEVCITHSSPNLRVMTEVWCYSKSGLGLEASYTGEPEHIPEFFAILDSVKKN